MAENYIRLTEEQAMAIYGLTKEEAESFVKHAYPPCERILPRPRPKVVKLATATTVSVEVLKERIARETEELMAKEGDKPDLGWHRTMARIHEEVGR
jgi:hypothetical protein